MPRSGGVGQRKGAPKRLSTTEKRFPLPAAPPLPRGQALRGNDKKGMLRWAHSGRTILRNAVRRANVLLLKVVVRDGVPASAGMTTLSRAISADCQQGRTRGSLPFIVLRLLSSVYRSSSSIFFPTCRRTSKTGRFFLRFS
jgi:hypothetical protein